MISNDEIRNILLQCELKITPQRIVILEALLEMRNHPTAENIIDYIKNNHPNIAVGTIYKALETFVEKGIIRKVNTEKDIMRYDAITEKHHHIHITGSDTIEDYYDEELDKLLQQYFNEKKIPGLVIEDVKLQISGRKHS